MSLIVCGQHCKHQQDGYCALDRISNLTSEYNVKCGYFEAENPKNSDQAQKDASTAYHFDRL